MYKVKFITILLVTIFYNLNADIKFISDKEIEELINTELLPIKEDEVRTFIINLKNDAKLSGFNDTRVIDAIHKAIKYKINLNKKNLNLIYSTLSLSASIAFSSLCFVIVKNHQNSINSINFISTLLYINKQPAIDQMCLETFNLISLCGTVSLVTLYMSKIFIGRWLNPPINKLHKIDAIISTLKRNEFKDA